MSSPAIRDVDDPTGPGEQQPEPRARRRWPTVDDLKGDKGAVWAFATYVAFAVPYLFWLGKDHWFFGDEWTFIAGRGVNLGDLFRDHNQHWQTVPLLVYRGLYSVFHLHTYLPYLAAVIFLHLGIAVLLRVIMRRSGVNPWIATIAAGAFVLLGPAENNILWAFQIGFTATLVFALGQIVMADHDGPIDRRDAIGLGLGLLALMSSGQAPPLIAATGLVCVLRRRWAAAALHTVPLGVIFLVWFTLNDIRSDVSALVGTQDARISQYGAWLRMSAEGVFMALGRFTPLAIALGLVLVAGAIVASIDEGTGLLRRAPIPVALLGAAFLSAVMSGTTRMALGLEQAKAGRFVGVLAALVLPAVAVAADALVRRWHAPAAIALSVFLIPLPFNATLFNTNEILTPGFYQSISDYVVAVADHPAAREVPPWVKPNDTILGQPDMTVGWLLDARDRGELPSDGAPLPPARYALIQLELGLPRIATDQPEATTCEERTQPLELHLRVGERIYVEGGAWAGLESQGQQPPAWRGLEPGLYEAVLPDLDVIIAPSLGETSYTICR